MLMKRKRNHRDAPDTTRLDGSFVLRRRPDPVSLGLLSYHQMGSLGSRAFGVDHHAGIQHPGLRSRMEKRVSIYAVRLT